MPKGFLDVLIQYSKQNPDVFSKTENRPLRHVNADEIKLLNEEQKKEGKMSNYKRFVFAQDEQLSLDVIQHQDAFSLVQHLESVQVTISGTRYCCGILVTKELHTPFSLGYMLQCFGFKGMTTDIAMWQHFAADYQQIKECFYTDELYQGHKVNWFKHTVPTAGNFKLLSYPASTEIAVSDAGRKRPRV